VTSAEPLTWSEAHGGLRLGLGRASGNVHLALENVGDAPLEVFSHVLAAGETHYDWFTVILEGTSGRRELTLVDERNRSARIHVTLAPGEHLQHEIDVVAWARRSINGATPLEPGTYEAAARYAVPPEDGFWSGTLTAGPAPLTI
jgi:hypothetical protein